jgi:hypothetical protein
MQDQTQEIDNAVVLPKDPKVLLLVTKKDGVGELLLLEYIGGQEMVAILKQMNQRNVVSKENKLLDPVGTDVYVLDHPEFEFEDMAAIIDLTYDVVREICSFDTQSYNIKFIVNY